MKVKIPQNLPEKFRAPAHGQYETFESSFGQKLSVLRFEEESAKADFIVQTGLNEPKEKNSELYKDLAARGYNVHTMDWPYQGFSDGSDEHRRRHTNGIAHDIHDFDRFVDYVLATRKSAPDTPLYMLGHSYGGHVISHYVSRKDHQADAVLLTAPMIDFYFKPEKTFRSLSMWGSAAHGLAKVLSGFFGSNAYAPGCTDWSAEDRIDGPDIFSNDPERKQLSNLWIEANPKTQVGRPTLGWVMDSIESCRLLKQEDFSHLKIPFAIAVAGGEVITDNNAMFELITRVPNGRILSFPKAKHEMWMCDDGVRNGMLAHIDRTVEQLLCKRRACKTGVPYKHFDC